MTSYIVRRFLYMLMLLALTSLVAFMVIVLPPGDFLTAYANQLRAQGDISEQELESLRHLYGLDRPMYVQYYKWVTNFIRGDLGMSFNWSRPVSELIGERLGMTILVSVAALLVTYLIAVPVGIYSATHQYSGGDYFFTFIAFIGMSVPNFLLALILMIALNKTLGLSIGGLFSVEFKAEPWSAAKAVDLLKHLPIPLLVIGLSGTASIMRIMRGMLLDELNKPYVTTARAKGLTERKLLFKYPVRIALNPIASTIGWALPAVFSGQTIVSIVLDLPTIGPLLYQALMSEDMFLAASAIMITTSLTVVGMFLSDMLLAWLDPRITYT
ncbi:MAG: ABC transporter permease [Chloroflexi bacterium]|nr:ABC transporter permease [Chloroflexota bacterium]